MTVRQHVAAEFAAADRRPSPLVRRWLGLRNRLLASEGFQRWAARFPLTRPLARRRARELFDLTAGFVYSQVLLACVQLRLFDRLAEGPRDLVDLAAGADLPAAAMQRLLLAAETLRLVQRCGGESWCLGDLGAAMLGNPGISAMIDHHTRLYQDLADPIALLRGRDRTALGHYWPYAGAERPESLAAEEVGAYTDLMAASQGFVAADVLDAYEFKHHRRLLDLGGGDGTFVSAVAHAWPHLAATVFDLPAVAERAKQHLEREGLRPRAQAIGGDLFAGGLPDGFDIVSLVRVLHDHDDTAVRAILQAARSALVPGGVLLIAEPMAETPGAEPIGHAYFGFYLMAMGSGRPRTAGELKQMLRDAGFSASREVATLRPLLVRILVATN